MVAAGRTELRNDMDAGVACVVEQSIRGRSGERIRAEPTAVPLLPAPCVSAYAPDCTYSRMPRALAQTAAGPVHPCPDNQRSCKFRNTLRHYTHIPSGLVGRVLLRPGHSRASEENVYGMSVTARHTLYIHSLRAFAVSGLHPSGAGGLLYRLRQPGLL